MLNAAFGCVGQEEYSIVRDSAIQNINTLNVLDIINLESGDFTTTLGRYTQGKQLIFINKSWAVDNLDTIGLLYPTSLLTSIKIEHFCAFTNEYLNIRLRDLANSGFLIIPIVGVAPGKYNLKTSSINIGNWRGSTRSARYIGGMRVQTRNQLYINSNDLLIMSIFLYGVEITEANLEILVNKLKLSLPNTILLSNLAKQIVFYKKSMVDDSDDIRYNYLESVTRSTSLMANTDDVSHPLFNITKSYWGGSGSGRIYFSIGKILWVIQNELALANISDEMETII
jgi:hypothetical protein